MTSPYRVGFLAFACTLGLAPLAHSLPFNNWGEQDWRTANKAAPPPKVVPASNCAIAEYGGFANPADDLVDAYVLAGSCLVNIASADKDPVMAKVNVHIAAEWSPKLKRASETVKVVHPDKTLTFSTWATCDKDPFLLNANAACKDHGMGGPDFSLFLRKADAPFARNRVQSAALYTAKITSRADLKKVGKVTGVQVDAAEAGVGQSVTLSYTAEGGPGACPVEFDWGDGDVQGGSLWASGRARHAYKKAGSFTAKARALPGCSGEASATIVVKAPIVDAVADVDPPAKTGLESKIAISGRSGECKMKVDFGDGKTTIVSANFPSAGGKHVIGHAYDSPGRKQVTVKGTEGCGGTATGAVDVAFATIKSAKWSGNVEKTQTFHLTSDGAVCPLRIEWGDGTVEEKRVTFEGGTAMIYRPYYKSKGKVLVSFRGIDGCMGVVGVSFTAN